MSNVKRGLSSRCSVQYIFLKTCSDFSWAEEYDFYYTEDFAVKGPVIPGTT